MNPIKSIRLVISQPVISKTPSEWDFHNDDAVQRTIGTFAERSALCTSLLGKSIEEIMPHLVVGEKQCQYCKAKAACPEYAKTVDVATDEEFEILPEDGAKGFVAFGPAELAALYLKTPMIRKWCDAIDDKVTGKVMSGEITEEHGLKVVAGKMGNRAWDDAEAVEVELKAMRLKVEQMYDFKLISPTTAEKVMADNPRKWKKISAHIKQAPGKPSVVPSTDKRPAIDVRPTASGFDEIAPEVVTAPAVVVEDGGDGDDLC